MDNKDPEHETDQMIKLGDLETFSENLHCEKSEATQEGSPVERQKWTSHLEYILSMVGYSVGFGNLWRFPYLCNRNGGEFLAGNSGKNDLSRPFQNWKGGVFLLCAFLIPYMLFLMITGFPMFYLESRLGQFSGKDAVRVWSFCPLLRGTGVGSVILTALFVPFYMILLAWPIYYMAKSCSSVLPWTTCNNTWNTPLCVEDISSISSNISVSVNRSDAISAAELWKNKSLAHTSIEEFWQYNVLNVSSGVEELGAVQWHIVVCLFAAYVIVTLCLYRGVKSVGKVVYVTALLPYILLIVIFIRTVMQPGAVDGMLYYVKPDFTRLLSIQVWLEACLQVFYSLGPGWGLLCTAASYNKFHEPCLRDAIIVCAISEGTSVFAGLVTFVILGVMAETYNVPISEVVSSGPGLGFVAYPQALAQLPFPQLWSFLFFLMLLSIGLDSQFLNVEVVLTAIMDGFPRRLHKRRLLVLCVVCLVCFLIGILFCTQGGPYLFQLLDWYVASLSVFIICVMECIATTWIYGVKQLSADAEMMFGKPLPVLIRILWAIVTPAVLLMAFILTLMRYQPPTYGKYTFPDYSIVLGWILAASSLIPLPVYAFMAVRTHMASNSLSKSVTLALNPDKDWRPSPLEFREIYQENLHKIDHSMRSSVKAIFQG